MTKVSLPVILGNLSFEVEYALIKYTNGDYKYYAKQMRRKDITQSQGKGYIKSWSMIVMIRIYEIKREYPLAGIPEDLLNE